MKIRLTDRAARELAEIGDYILKHDPRAAARVEGEIRSSFQLIAEYPLLGRRLEQDVHRLTLPNYPYLIFYRVVPGHVDVLAIRHASRSPEFG